uniref:Fatty acid desaturase domain-containing protein n=1 Tax=Brassica campestris TaxID=3711 RepID=M4D1B6_BRACM
MFDRPGGDRQNKRQENCPWTTRTAAKLTFTRLRTEKGEKVEPDKELCHGDDDGLSQLRGEESLADMEGLPVRETLAKDHVEGHDCAHESFSKNKLVEDIVGTLAFLPLVDPYEPWRFKHDRHHAKTNTLVRDTA